MSGIDLAFAFYKKHIHDEEKMNLLQEYRLKIAGSVPSVLWELFGALLTGRKGTGAGDKGADLLGWEVKSSRLGGNYEYQYHLNTGAEKLLNDCVVNHLFCSYSENYENVIVRAMRGIDLSEDFFRKWEPGYNENYDKNLSSIKRRQRFRRNIPYSHIQKNGVLILKIDNTEISVRNDQDLERLNDDKS